MQTKLIQQLGDCLYDFVAVDCPDTEECSDCETCYITSLLCCENPTSDNILQCDGNPGSESENSDSSSDTNNQNNDNYDDDSDNDNYDDNTDNSTTGSDDDNPQNDNNDDYVDAPVAVLPPYKKECNKIKKLFENYSSLKDELEELESKVNDTIEKGKYIKKGALEINDFENGEDGGITIGDYTYKMMAHTHNSPADSTYSVFSYMDFYSVNELLKDGHIKKSKFVSFLMTADGTRYAFTISNQSKFLKFFATILDDNYDSITAFNRVKQRNKYFTSKDPNKPPLIQENSTDYQKDLKYLLSFLQDNQLGITMFEVDENYETFKKLKYDKQNNNIDKTNCN